MMRTFHVVFVVTLMGGGLAAQEAITFHGKIDGPVTWRGNVMLDGDVEVTASGHLTIEPGTKIQLALTDVANLGWLPSLVEIHVHGSLSISGDTNNPVSFTSSGGGTALNEVRTPRWHGIVLYPPRDEKTVRHVRFAIFKHAYSALQVPEGGLTIEGCVFLQCEVGVEAGSAFASRDVQGVKGGNARPRMTRCRFADCSVGVFAQGGGVPALDRCVFYKNWTGAGNARRGRTSPLRDPGTVSQQCDYIQNENAVFGPAVVMNSIFTGNRVALSPSHFHATYDSNTDCLSYTANLFYGNDTVISGESSTGSALLDKDPLYTDGTDTLLSDWPPLPDALRLQSGSPAIGAATHGGDLGSLGADRRSAGKVTWETTRTLAKELRVLFMPDGLSERGAKGFPATARKSTPNPGADVGKAWWSVVTTGDDGGISLRELFRGPDQRGWVALEFEATEAGQIELEVNGDLADALIVWNKKVVYELKSPRRWHTEGILQTLELKEGSNFLVVEVKARSGDARFGIAYRTATALSPANPRAAGPLAISRAAMIAKNGTRHLQIRTKQPLNWTHDGQRALVTIKDGRGGTLRERLPVTVVSENELKIGPILDPFEGPLTIENTRLLNPHGVPFEGLEKPVAITGSK